MLLQCGSDPIGLGWAQNSTFLTSSDVLPMLLVQENTLSRRLLGIPYFSFMQISSSLLGPYGQATFLNSSFLSKPTGLLDQWNLDLVQSILLGRQLHLKIQMLPWPGGLVGASSCTQQSCMFDPWSGHIPRLWVRSPARTHRGGY